MTDSVKPTGRGVPGWDLWRQGLAGSSWSKSMRVAGAFAFDSLERDLGRNWPDYAASKFGIPGEFGLSSSHLFAVVRLIELALRLDALRSHSGLGKVRKILKRSPSREELQHITIALEIGALGLMNGLDVELEVTAASGGPPVDIKLSQGAKRLIVEIRSIFRDEASVEASYQADELTEVIFRLRVAHGVAIGGRVWRVLDPEAVSNIAHELDRRARFVRKGGLSPPLKMPGVDLHVVVSGDPDDESISISIPMEDHWGRLQDRLEQKAARASESGAEWLRFDSLDLLWQLGPLREISLSQRLAAISNRAQQWLAPFPHIHGIVLSDGAWMVSVTTEDSTCAGGTGCFGIHRRLDRIRAREGLIVALSQETAAEAEMWFDLYDKERAWMEWALARQGMALPDELILPQAS